MDADDCMEKPTNPKDISSVSSIANGTAVGPRYDYINKPNRQWHTFSKKQENSEECVRYTQKTFTLLITLFTALPPKVIVPYGTVCSHAKM